MDADRRAVIVAELKANALAGAVNARPGAWAVERILAIADAIERGHYTPSEEARRIARAIIAHAERRQRELKP
jgi:hypothetical protein